MKKHIKTSLRLIFFLALGVAILYYVYNEQAVQFHNFCTDQGNAPDDCNLIDKVVDDLKNARTLLLVIALMLYFLSNISRAIRWKILVEPDNGSVRTRNTFLTTLVGYFANLAIPRFGEFVRAGLLAKYERIEPANVMGTVVTDRLLDIFSLLLMFGMGMILASGQIMDYVRAHAQLPNVSWLLITGLSLGIMLSVGLAVYLAMRFRSHRIVIKIHEKIRSFIKGVMSIRRVKNYKWLIFHSVNIWLMYYLMTYLPLLSIGPTSHLSPVAGLLVFIFGGLGMVLPTPGGIGTYHAMTIAGLSIYGISGPDAFSVAMIIFVLINICVNLLMGLLSLIILPTVNKDYHPIR